ncbi:MAG: DUF1800 family protein [Pirellulales bacterium]
MSHLMQENRWPHDPAAAWLAYEPNPQDPWDLAKVLRLHRRAGFGATWAEAQRDLADGHQAAIARMLDGAPLGPDGRPAAAIDAFTGAMFESYRTSPSALDPIRMAWFYRLIFTAWPLRERMLLAWHTHYATSETRVYEKSTLIEQHLKQRELWRSPVSKLHLAMLRDPAMLRWLDGTSNLRGAPNENLGREFLELFALGVGNYDESDVREAARALTGWQYVSERRPPLKYMPSLHDTSEKTVLGQTGAWADEDLARIACAHPAATQRIAWRLWRTFISDVDEPSPELLEGLAASMRADGDVDVARGLEVLLRSRLFHSDAYAGRRVMSPVEWTVSVVRSGQTFPPHPNLIEVVAAADRMGQRLFMPPNVAGWPGGLEWLSDPALVARQNFAAWLTSDESTVAADHWQKLTEKYGVLGAEAELDLWTALFWGRLPDDEERAALSEQLRTDDPAARAATVAALLSAPDAQLA